MEELSADELILEGLAARFPGRVRRSLPEPAALPDSPGWTALWPRSIRFVRIHRLPEGLAILRPHLAEPWLIVDLRNVHAGLGEASPLAAALGGNGVVVEVVGDGDGEDGRRVMGEGEGGGPEVIRPPLVLVNGHTSGALEAVLLSLQRAGRITIVGTRTAGRTGDYQRLEVGGGYFVVRSHVQPSGGPPLVGVGLTPEVPVEVAEAADEHAYFALSREVGPEPLLRYHLSGVRAPEADGPPGNGSGSVLSGGGDAIAQRAVDMVVALQLLGPMAD